MDGRSFWRRGAAAEFENSRAVKMDCGKSGHSKVHCVHFYWALAGDDTGIVAAAVSICAGAERSPHIIWHLAIALLLRTTETILCRKMFLFFDGVSSYQKRGFSRLYVGGFGSKLLVSKHKVNLN